MAVNENNLEYNPQYTASPASNTNSVDNDGVRYKVGTGLSVFSKKVGNEVNIGSNNEIPAGKKIRIVGQYPQNFIDIDTYDISKLRIINDLTFEFIVRVTTGNPSEHLPLYYTSAEFYERLEDSLRSNNPHLVNQYVDVSAIIDIDVLPLLEKIRNLRTLELKTEVVVTKNLFLKSVATDETFEQIIETVLYSDLIGYINWVTDKPSANYDTRLLSARQIGESVFFEPEPVESVDDNPPEPDEPPEPLNQPEYPPIGRGGAYVGELVQTEEGDEYEWTGTIWKEYERDDDDNFTPYFR